MGHGVDGKDAADSLELEHGDGQDSDGAGSPNRGRFAGDGVGEVEGVEGDGKGFEECPFGEAEAGGEGEDVVGGEVDDVAEEAGVGAGAVEADVVAEVVATGTAHGAVVAVDGGFEDDAFAGADDGAGGLVAQHHREDGGGVADVAFGEVMQIRAADADGVDTDLDFAGAWRGRGRGFDEFETVLGDELGGAHGRIIRRFS